MSAGESKQCKAYHVGENSEGEEVIVFATSGATARRLGGNKLGLMFDEVRFCRRAPWADRFAYQPFIPAEAYHANGWWQYCNNCEKQLYDDAKDEDGNPLEIAYDGPHAYCDQGCKECLDAEIAVLNEKGEKFKASVVAARPDLTFTKFIAGWPHITCIAEFTFPGGKYKGSMRDQEGDGDVALYIANGDLEAWHAYEVQRIQP